VAVPVLVHGEATVVVVRMQDFEGGWRVTGLDFDRAADEYRALQEVRAEALAEALLTELKGELRRDTWQQLDVYVERHPDSPVAAGLHEVVGELLEAPTPVTVESAWLYKKGLLGFRQAHAKLRNEGDQAITGLSLRFTLRDDSGRKVRNVNGEDLPEPGARSGRGGGPGRREHAELAQLHQGRGGGHRAALRRRLPLGAPRAHGRSLVKG
jgi:hypothetical protein